MVVLMRSYAKFVIAIALFTVVVIVYFNPKVPIDVQLKVQTSYRVANKPETKVSIWVTVTKISHGYLLAKFRKFFKSLIGRRGTCHSTFELNLITDNESRPTLDNVISEYLKQYEETRLQVIHHDFQDVLKTVHAKIEPLKRFFQSSKGSYYSDDVFYLSPALHLVAPDTVDKAVVLDVDTEFHSSVCDLHNIFDNFTDTEIFGLAPELSPVYHHILWKWRYFQGEKRKPKAERGNMQGLNSGVVLLNLERMRNNNSVLYDRLISPQWISTVVQKYLFKGHLGDQDWYTLVSFEYPEMIYQLECGWNRQLCTWWKHHGYAETFDSFAKCDGKINLYHGNCNTPIPSN
ncbi:xyloside xylosyltransferase 1 [Adelges cooleyi]|uniref:xyloside xylosyltransferase 1 n=1 Tax=Adelges cooleyi TaxID=133065 RepID=UPI00217FA9A5|nr:xyloside xylosyltransferase 1 [Adelges cooleyi]